MQTLNNLRSLFAVITLSLTLGLGGCLDGSNPTAPPASSNPTTPPNANGNGSGNSSGTGNGGGSAVKTGGAIMINGNGYNNEKFVPGTTTYYATMGVSNISMAGAWKGQSFALLLSQGTGVGRYIWNTLAGNMVSMGISPAGQYIGVSGETIIEEVDVRNGVVRGSFRGIVAHTLDTSVQVEISGTFEAAITF